MERIWCGCYLMVFRRSSDQLGCSLSWLCFGHYLTGESHNWLLVLWSEEMKFQFLNFIVQRREVLLGKTHCGSSWGRKFLVFYDHFRPLLLFPLTQSIARMNGPSNIGTFNFLQSDHSYREREPERGSLIKNAVHIWLLTLHLIRAIHNIHSSSRQTLHSPVSCYWQCGYYKSLLPHLLCSTLVFPQVKIANF